MTVPPSTARSWTRPLALTMLALLIVPSMLGFKGGCKCKPDDTGDTEDSDAAWQKIKLERKLQVSRIMPDLVEPNTGLTADIIGAGLQERATVAVGPFEGTNVRVHTDARLSVDLPPLPQGAYDVTVTNPDGESVTLRRALSVQPKVDVVDCSQLTVQFGFNEDVLSREARDAIDPLIPCYTAVGGRIRIEGHADERGTTDYNLALGQRRADAVHSYLSGSGVPVRVLRTVSYGEERPVDRSHTEAAWAKNRRVEIVVED